VKRERSALFSGRSGITWMTGLAVFGAFAAGGIALSSGAHDAPAAPTPSARRAADVAPVRSPRPIGSISHRSDLRRFPRETPRVVEPSAAGASGIAAGQRAMGERDRLVATAHRELDQLARQEPKNFLAIFDMMKEGGEGNEKAIEAGRRESHTYILARMRVLEGMLRRFMEDPDSDHTLESDELARLDAEFRGKVDALARDVPAMANLAKILTSTILKAPAFTDHSPEEE
jgi:hypothetical protein